MLPIMWKQLNQDLWTLHRNVDELFNRFFGPMEGQFTWMFSTGSTQPATWYPAVESYTADGEFHINVHLPGVDPKQIQIRTLGKELLISGERPWQEEWEKSRQYFFREVPYGRFERTISLPEHVDDQKIRAKFQDGVLQITLPVSSAVAPKKIAIESAEAAIK